MDNRKLQLIRQMLSLAREIVCKGGGDTRIICSQLGTENTGNQHTSFPMIPEINDGATTESRYQQKSKTAVPFCGNVGMEKLFSLKAVV